MSTKREMKKLYRYFNLSHHISFSKPTPSPTTKIPMLATTIHIRTSIMVSRVANMPLLRRPISMMHRPRSIMFFTNPNSNANDNSNDVGKHLNITCGSNGRIYNEGRVSSSSFIRRLYHSHVPNCLRRNNADIFRMRGAYFSTSLCSSDDNDDDDDDGRGPNIFEYYPKISFVGAGKMAEALIEPLVGKKVNSSSSSTTDCVANIHVCDVSDARLEFMKESYGNKGVYVTSSLEECITGANLIVVAVKPQNCEVVFQEIRKFKMDEKTEPTILSIVAGVPIEHFMRGMNLKKVARSMPNTPATIQKGVTVFTTSDGIDADEKSHIRSILQSFGKAVYVDDENFIDMATAISGSGPAYIFLLMEAMIDAGVHMGFSRSVAQTLVHQTILGSTLYAIETKEHPAILRNSVTSPAGTTASAIYELENGRFRTVIKDAIWVRYCDINSCIYILRLIVLCSDLLPS